MLLYFKMLTHSLSMNDYVALAVDDVDDAKNENTSERGRRCEEKEE